MPKLTDRELMRYQVHTLTEAGHSHQQIAKQLKKQVRWVKDTLKNYPDPKNIKDKPRSGRKRILDETQVENIVAYVKEHPKIKRRKLPAVLKKEKITTVGSKRTISRRLDEAGVHMRLSHLVPKLIRGDATKRMNYAKLHKEDDFHHKIYMDEKLFKVNSTPGRNSRWRHVMVGDPTPGTPVSTTDRSTVKLMGFLYFGGLKIVFLDGPVDSAKVVDKFASQVKPWLEEEFGEEEYEIVMDNAPWHSSKLTKDWMNDNSFPYEFLPPRSPDLNPIENLWGMLANSVDEEAPTDEKSLKKAIQKCYKQIKLSTCFNLISSMKQRFCDVLSHKIRGKQTKW